eukprot:c13195_g1_i1.p1 GENE.c13195_g1_i1~~c13195_g1_i1.p1  ORF type:complete len:280 (+),score=117.49 c13195_g1_i1:42-842(+)
MNDYKTVVVTGGGAGIGEAICLKLKSEGVKNIVVVDININEAKSVANKLGQGGVALQCDCGDDESIKNLIEKVENEIGPIDMFVVNAGVLVLGDASVPNKSWDLIHRVNVMQGVYVARHLIPRMLKRGKGSIAITASAAGLLTQIGSLPYALTKRTSVALAEWLYITYSTKNIKVFCICPQGVNTAMSRGDIDNPASVDGVIEASDVANCFIDGVKSNSFLILPHPQVKDYMKRKAEDTDRWLKGMARMNQKYASVMERAAAAAKL